ncbi:MBL fold metallo-hydrolase [Candidatus Peregrinibacteria bacterium]|nr:MBL fold metallo-hydrolase [Candidatus Peregrinibacteria bacterium]
MNAISFSRFWFWTYGTILTVIFLLSLFLSRLPNSDPEIIFFDIGQGDSILIRTPLFQNILIDGGPSETDEITSLGEVLPFFDRTIDFMILTHPHADHVRGLLAVLERYEVKGVLFTGVAYESEFYTTFLQNLTLKNIPVFIARNDEDFFLGNGMYLDILYPFSPLTGKHVSDINSSSIVLRFVSDKVSVLLTGDAQEKIESQILKKGFTLSSILMKAGHHGSSTSNSEAFIDAIQPRYVVIQSGQNNNYGHPHKKILQRFSDRAIEIFRNDIQGRIKVTLTDNGCLFTLEKGNRIMITSPPFL